MELRDWAQQLAGDPRRLSLDRDKNPLMCRVTAMVLIRMFHDKLDPKDVLDALTVHPNGPRLPIVPHPGLHVFYSFKGHYFCVVSSPSGPSILLQSNHWLDGVDPFSLKKGLEDRGLSPTWASREDLTTWWEGMERSWSNSFNMFGMKAIATSPWKCTFVARSSGRPHPCGIKKPSIRSL